MAHWQFDRNVALLPQLNFFSSNVIETRILAEKVPMRQKLINPFLPTGQFMAPKLIILVKCLIDILYFKVLFNVSLCRTRCEFGMHNNHVQVF